MAAFLKLIEEEAKGFAYKEFVRVTENDGLTFTTVEDVLKSVQFGDLVEFKRDRYFHWLFYIGDGFVLNFDASTLENLTAGNVLENHKGCVEKKLLKDIVGSSPCRINNKQRQTTERKLTIQPTETMKTSVELELNNPNKDYNVVKFNCEHFVTKLRFGIAFSDQIELTRKLVFDLAELFVELCVHIFKRSEKKE